MASAWPRCVSVVASVAVGGLRACAAATGGVAHADICFEAIASH